MYLFLSTERMLVAQSVKEQNITCRNLFCVHLRHKCQTSSVFLVFVCFECFAFFTLESLFSSGLCFVVSAQLLCELSALSQFLTSGKSALPSGGGLSWERSWPGL